MCHLIVLNSSTIRLPLKQMGIASGFLNRLGLFIMIAAWCVHWHTINCSFW